jgi:hypothetical protein
MFQRGYHPELPGELLWRGCLNNAAAHGSSRYKELSCHVLQTPQSLGDQTHD